MNQQHWSNALREHAAARPRSARVRRRSHRPGFTLAEILISIAIIFLLLGILIVGIRSGSRSIRASADRSSVQSIVTAVQQFKTQFGFVPPLVRDNEGSPPPVQPLSGGPLNAGGTAVVVLDPGANVSSADRAALVQFLAHRTNANAPLPIFPDARYSEYSLAYYVVGALSAKVDGVEGPGMRTPLADGSFQKSGRTFDPFFDVSKNSKALFAEDAPVGRIELRDRSGNAYRYYRWLRGRIVPASGNLDNRVQEPADQNLPFVLLDPSLSPSGRLEFVADPANLQKYAPPQSKDATYAIVGAGANGVFGDEDLAVLEAKLGIPQSQPEKLRFEAMRDNIVEFGR